MKKNNKFDTFFKDIYNSMVVEDKKRKYNYESLDTNNDSCLDKSIHIINTDSEYKENNNDINKSNIINYQLNVLDIDHIHNNNKCNYSNEKLYDISNEYSNQSSFSEMIQDEVIIKHDNCCNIQLNSNSSL